MLYVIKVWCVYGSKNWVSIMNVYCTHTICRYIRCGFIFANFASQSSWKFPLQYMAIVHLWLKKKITKITKLTHRVLNRENICHAKYMAYMYYVHVLHVHVHMSTCPCPHVHAVWEYFCVRANKCWCRPILQLAEMINHHNDDFNSPSKLLEQK